MITVDNAIILAAGFASRFAPLSQLRPKALLPVRGEILIERQIRQLQEAGISQIYVVTGYLSEAFSYLKEKCGVTLLHNPEYALRNNHSSIYAAKDVLANSYICSSDNYFPQNLFTPTAERPYYSALYADRPTEEWCLRTAPDGRITGADIGGENAWYMLGHVLWDETFSRNFLAILEEAYPLEETRGMLWETLYLQHIRELTLYQKSYPAGSILEFDALADLQAFDPFYRDKSPEEIMACL